MFGLLLFNSFSIETKGDLKLKISGLRNTKGQILVLLYDTDYGFPEKIKSACKILIVPINNETIEVSLNKIEYGEYSICIVHDENANCRLDKSLFGIPKEGLGYSNNPDLSKRIKPPDYDEAKFNFDENQDITIKLYYYLNGR